MLPIAGDQGPNARLMEERKVGVLVPRNDKDGSFSRDDVAGAVRAVVDSRVFAAGAKKLQEIVASTQCHEKYIDGFIQHLRT
jgi:UDP:flavonoid glycosyltransferase YjiC (YdhE family)